jgi:hypothetical protein
MSDTKGILLVGGPCDGQRRVVPIGTWEFEVSEFDADDFARALAIRATDSEAPAPVVTKIHTYREVDLKIRQRACVIFAYSDLEPVEIFTKLINGYNPQKEK